MAAERRTTLRDLAVKGLEAITSGAVEDGFGVAFVRT